MKIRYCGNGIVRRLEKHKQFLKTSASGSLNLIELPKKRFPFIDFNSTDFEQSVSWMRLSASREVFSKFGEASQLMVLICQFWQSFYDNII